MKGLGDNIYQRAFIKAITGEVYLETPWPELYKDLTNVKFLRPTTNLRTQAKNINRNLKWSERPIGYFKKISYVRFGIIEGMRRTFNVQNKEFDLPCFGGSPVEGSYIVVRPVTVRSEWNAEARNPLPEYIAQATAQAKAKGYKIVSVADLEDSKEWALEPIPVADAVYHKGELDVSELMALIAGACGVIGGIGWIVPAAISAKINALIVCGGQGGFNSPELITSPCMDLSKIHFLVPDNFCKCTQKQHNCDKRITDYDKRVTEWIDKLPSLVR